MITIVGMWEKGWLDPKVELFMFRQLKGAFKYDRLVMVPKLLDGYVKSVDQYNSMDEALATLQGIKVFLEPEGSHRFSDIPKNKDVTFILGNANTNNQKYINSEDLSVRIDSPGMTHMFAVNVAAIALDRINGNR